MIEFVHFSRNWFVFKSTDSIECTFQLNWYHIAFCQIPPSLHNSKKADGPRTRARDQFHGHPSSQDEIADTDVASTSYVASAREHEGNRSLPGGLFLGKRDTRGKAMRRKHPSGKDDEILGEGTSPKRSRRLGARENDMMLRQVGSHCIMIGVKDQVMSTDNSDNTQSESDTTETGFTSSQDDEGSLVIDERPQKQKTPPRKGNRTGKAKPNLVKVSALCRAAAWLERQERHRQGNPKELISEDPEKSVKLQEKDNSNNSCSKSEFSDMSDEDIFKNHLEGELAGYPEQMPSLINLDGFNEDSNMTTAGSSAESTVSESNMSYVDRSAAERRYRSNYPSRDEPMEFQNEVGQGSNYTQIQPFARYLRLQPRQVDNEHAFRGACNIVERGTPMDCPTTSVNGVEQRKVGGKGNSRKRSKSKKIIERIRGFDLNFPFTMGGVAATHLSSIAESCTFMGINNRFQESSQDSMSCFSDDEMTSTSDCMDRDRAFGLGTFAQDDEHSFLTRLFKSPGPLRKMDKLEPERHRRRRRHPKKERKPKKPRRSRRLRRKRSQGSEEETSANGSMHVHKRRNCSCCS